MKKNPPLIHPNFLSGEFKDVLPLEKLEKMFMLLSTSADEIKENYIRIRNTKSKLLVYDPYIRSFFEEKPLFRLSNGNYVAVHKPLVLKRFTEGLFDISYEHFGSEFSKEFGFAFENYIKKLLPNLGSIKVISENEIKKYTENEICDFIVVNNNYILFIESKAVEYSAMLATENAVKNNNSTTKVSKAIDQLFSTSNLVKSGKLQNLIGDVSSKKFLSIVVTFRQIFGVNGDEYWNEVILPKTKNQKVSDSS